MKRLDVVSTVIDELESSIAGIETDLSSISNTPPVHTWGGVDSTETPVMLVDDRKGHREIPVGNNHYDGEVIDDTTGQAVGKRRLSMYEGRMELVTRIRHQTDSYRMISDVKDHFRLVCDTPERYFGDDIREASLGREFTKEVEYRSAEEVYQQALPIHVKYVDVIEDSNYEPLEEIHRDITRTN